MHGLINRTIQFFVTDTYGAGDWQQLCEAAAIGVTDFEAMLSYDSDMTERLLVALEAARQRPRGEILEDIGTYLVSHPSLEALRRLLRFGGTTFTEFLHSLDDLPDRARLAVAELDLPRIELRGHGADRFSLTCRGEMPGFGHVLVGVLRALADDYGALVLLAHEGGREGTEIVTITLVEQAYAEGRSFDLGARAG